MPACGRESGGDGKGHGQRQGDQADGDAGDQIVEKFVGVVVAQTKDRLRKPTFFEESTRHFSIMQQDIGGRKRIAKAREHTKEHGPLAPRAKFRHNAALD